MFCPELSLLAFQRRVLALAEDPRTPLRERLRFLGIVTANLDELYMVRMAELRRAALDDALALAVGDDGLTAAARLAAVEAEVASILSAQARCAERCLQDAVHYGVHLVSWDALDDGARASLVARCREEIQPGLTPLAMTMSPGHPLPHLPHLGLSLAVVFRATGGGEERQRLAEVELPGDVARLMEVPGRRGSVIAIEDVLRANAGMLHPNAAVEGAYLLRVTRGGDLGLDEGAAADLLDAVDSATKRRPMNPAGGGGARDARACAADGAGEPASRGSAARHRGARGSCAGGARAARPAVSRESPIAGRSRAGVSALSCARSRGGWLHARPAARRRGAAGPSSI